MSIGVHEDTKSWMGIGKAGFHKHVKEDYGHILLYPHGDDFDPCEDYEYIACSQITQDLKAQNKTDLLAAIEEVYQEAIAHECSVNNYFMQENIKDRGIKR